MQENRTSSDVEMDVINACRSCAGAAALVDGVLGCAQSPPRKCVLVQAVLLCRDEERLHGIGESKLAQELTTEWVKAHAANEDHADLDSLVAA